MLGPRVHSDLLALPRPQAHPGTGRRRAEVPTRPHTVGVLVRALTRAWRWQKLLDKEVYCSVIEIAEAEKMSKSYASRILRLALLAPGMVEAILGGLADQRVMLERLERPLPMEWEEQHAAIRDFWPKDAGA